MSNKSGSGACGPVPASVVVICATFLSNLLYGGVSHGAGIFFDNFLETFNSSRSATAWIISLQNLILYLTGSLVATAALIATAFATSVNYLYVSFGVSIGFGFGLIHVANLVVVQQHTTRMRVLAAALSLTGSVLGGFILPFLVRWSTSTYGWRGCQLLLAGVVLHCLPCAMLTRSPPTLPVTTDGQTASKDGVTAKSTTGDTVIALRTWVQPSRYCSPQEETTKRQTTSSVNSNTPCKLRDIGLLLDPVCLLCAVSYFFIYGGMVIPYTYLPSKARTERIPTYRATMLISVFSIGEIIGRLATGFIGATRQMLPTPIFLCSSVLAGGVTMAIGFCHSYTSFLGISVTCGILFGKFQEVVALT